MRMVNKLFKKSRLTKGLDVFVRLSMKQNKTMFQEVVEVHKMLNPTNEKLILLLSW